ncbi:MAG: V-type ATP synthase subunit E [Clostridia bacterium]|nr:V-type ATP synthase subunit E [Clostridia bacterium]
MEGKEGIIAKIKEDAELKVKSIVDASEKAYKEKIDEANAWAKDYENAQEDLLKRDATDIITRKMTLCDLEVRKISLFYKQQTVKKVFASAYDMLLSMRKKEYLNFVNKLLTANAEDGDEIVLSCDGVLTEKDLSALEIVKSKNLTVSKKTGDFKGGIYLIGKVCDKDLTFSKVVEEKEEDWSKKIADRLFGE